MTVNPFRPGQVSRISLLPEDVDAIAFWTRNPAPLMPHLGRLEERGYFYYFLYTLLDYPSLLDPDGESLLRKEERFRRLSDRLGPHRVLWRYDPVVIGSLTGPDFHKERFRAIAKSLEGYTDRVIVSFMDPYRKTRRRLQEAEREGGFRLFTEEEILPERGGLLEEFRSVAETYGMRLSLCCEESKPGDPVLPSAHCVTSRPHLADLDGEAKRDAGQRKLCTCSPSRDIGMYESCPRGCVYCYATANFPKARSNRARHNPDHPFLLA